MLVDHKGRKVVNPAVHFKHKAQEVSYLRPLREKLEPSAHKCGTLFTLENRVKIKGV